MALLASAIYSCDDTTGSLGLDMLPEVTMSMSPLLVSM
jgi:hypothetical protein